MYKELNTIRKCPILVQQKETNNKVIDEELRDKYINIEEDSNEYDSVKEFLNKQEVKKIVACLWLLP